MDTSRAAVPLSWRLPLAAMAVLLLCVASAWADQKTVLVLYGTRMETRIAALGDRELPRLLEHGLGERVSYQSEYLDLGRFTDARYRSVLTDFLRLKYLGQQFDLVIAMNEIVLDFLVSKRAELFPSAPIVFFSDTPIDRPPSNTTGIVSETDFAPSLALAATLQPTIRRVYVVAGADVRDKAFETRARAQFRAFEPRLAITYLSGLPTPELRSRLSALPDDAVIYYLLVNRDGAGEQFLPLEYLENISEVANAPIYSWVDSAIGQGIVGGRLKSQRQQVAAVAELSVRVLRGEDPDSIPTASPDLQENVVDWQQLRRWGISESRLPADTLVMFKTASVWERYKTYVLAALALMLAQTVLLTALLAQRAQRRQAEEQVRGSQLKLQTSYDRIRTLGRRLLDAQDTERSRIARELHDDISQQLALLATDLEFLRTAPADDRTDLMEQAADRTQTVARSVHDLAYRLYPAKLTLIGLVPALRALQREMERSVIVVNFVDENVPQTLPQDVTLCVFRVVQEALQNALKYSSAREVSLSLDGSPDRLTIRLADDGVGFDVGAAWGKGLGLISMRERLEALNGRLEIYSTPAAGTRLVMTVPLPSVEHIAAAG